MTRIQTRGTCQVCGGDWAVGRGDAVSNHGYKRPRWGFMVGACAGSRATAAEKYNGLTQLHIKSSEGVIESATALAAAIEAEAREAGQWEDGSKQYYLSRGPTDRETSYERRVWENAKRRAEFKGETFDTPKPPLSMNERWNAADELRQNHADYVKFLTEEVMTKLGDEYREVEKGS